MMRRGNGFGPLGSLLLCGGAFACGGGVVDAGEVSRGELRTDRDETEAESDSAFDCGTSKCNLETEYCAKRTTYSDLSVLDRRDCIAGRGPCVTKKTTYRCRALPASCGETPACSCLDAEACTGSASRGLTASTIIDNRD